VIGRGGDQSPVTEKSSKNGKNLRKMAADATNHWNIIGTSWETVGKSLEQSLPSHVGKYTSTMGCGIDIPSGKLTVCYRKSPFSIGKPSINGLFPMAMLNNQRV
jgi:hypothetical protein